jgi:cytochrome bd-type quinol oxidase subunit 2
MVIISYFQRLKDGLLQAVSLLGYIALLTTFALPFVVFIYLKATNPPPPLMEDGRTDIAEWAGLSINYVSLEWLAIFSSVAFLGALGATVSLFGRHDLNEQQLRKQRTLVNTQLLGAAFASVLLFTFIGGLVQGSLFPYIQASSWTDLNIRVPEWSKLLVWSFIAGFSERFVPGLLDNLIFRVSKDDESSDRTRGR